MTFEMLFTGPVWRFPWDVMLKASENGDCRIQVVGCNQALALISQWVFLGRCERKGP
jgi:hypothetical protein